MNVFHLLLEHLVILNKFWMNTLLPYLMYAGIFVFLPKIGKLIYQPRFILSSRPLQ